MSKPGGLGNVKPIDSEALDVANKAKSAIESKAGTTFNTFHPTQYATQVVAGVNYFFKIDVGDGKFVHARVFKSLSQELSVHSVQTDHSADDALSYF